MCSRTMMIPIIHFSNIKQTTDSSWESTKSQVREALEKYGCFEATYDDHIPFHLRKAVFDALKQLFDLPLETRLRNKSNKPYRGYIGKRPAAPLFESLGIEDALSPGKIESFANLMWPQGNPSFSKYVGSFSEELKELGKIVSKMAIESLGLEKYMDEHMDSTTCTVRVQKYDAPQSDEPKPGVMAHKDKSFVTILYQNGIQGLEVMTKDGHWIPAGVSPNSFIVMIGESFTVWTNGRLYAPCHRVMMSGAEDRYSIGLFMIPKEGCIIEAREETVDDEHPLLYKPFDYYEYFAFLNRASPPYLKEYI